MDEKTKTDLPLCPECDKMLAIQNRSQDMGEFLDWLLNERGFHLAIYDEEYYDGEVLKPVRLNIQEILAEYFLIDLDKVEQERRALLEHLRARDKEPR